MSARPKKIGIIGGGAWGCAIAKCLAEAGHQVTIWAFEKEVCADINTNHTNSRFLPGVIFRDTIQASDDLIAVATGKHFLIFATPSLFTLPAVKRIVAIPDILEGRTIIGVLTKGFISTSRGPRMIVQAMEDYLPGSYKDNLVYISGPSHAEEVSRGIPTTVVAAAKSPALAIKIQQEFSTETFRIYTNTDVAGVELAASVKNVIALAAGISDGLGLGDNTKGALLTRGMVEMIRLGKEMGAEEQTFFGLAGIGDLITTCISRHSRNRKMGELIASGLSLKEALGKMVMVAEGVETTKSVYQLAKKFGIEMPITVEVYKALFENESPKQAIKNLMMRQFRPERW